MRELIVNTFATLDGVMQAPGGPGRVSQPWFERAVSFAVVCGGDTDNPEHGWSDRGRPRRVRGHSRRCSTPRRRRQGSRHVKSA